MADSLLLGVDGGGTRCRARLADRSGRTLGRGEAGPANIRLGLDDGLAAVLDVAHQCLREAGLARGELRRVVACLALAGASEPADLAAARGRQHPFRHVLVTTDADAACVGAHAGGDGGVVIVGTGSIGWARIAGRHVRVGGWGFPVSDEGSGAWLGCEIARRALWAHDGRAAWTPMPRQAFAEFRDDPHRLVRWMTGALPRDYARLAPLAVDQAARGDPEAVALMRAAAAHIDGLAARLAAAGAERLALAGGLVPHLEPWLAPATRCRLVPPAGDAVAGALRLAAAEAEALTEAAP